MNSLYDTILYLPTIFCYVTGFTVAYTFFIVYELTEYKCDEKHELYKKWCIFAFIVINVLLLSLLFIFVDFTSKYMILILLFEITYMLMLYELHIHSFNLICDILFHLNQKQHINYRIRLK